VIRRLCRLDHGHERADSGQLDAADFNAAVQRVTALRGTLH